MLASRNRKGYNTLAAICRSVMPHNGTAAWQRRTAQDTLACILGVRQTRDPTLCFPDQIQHVPAAKKK